MALNIIEGAVIDDRFRLVRPLGSGGMGEVWLARHAALDMLCAVKLIDLEAIASPELRARFEFEARAAAEIRSAHVVQILDHGVFEGRPYIAMEYLKGEDLCARLSRAHVLDARATAAIITQAARAVDRAQEARIVHRDLKPANLFLCREGDAEIVKVLDFGVAKRIGGSPGIKTVPGMLIGTLFYMSPEQAQRNRPVDHRSDLWALGVIAFRCLTGKLPFKSASPMETLAQIIAGPIPIPSRIAPVPIGFDTWWARASSRDPEHRFQSGKELADGLEMALGLSGTRDPFEPPPTARLSRWTTTLRMMDDGSPAPPPLPHAAPPAALWPSQARAPAMSQLDTPSPIVASIAPIVRPAPRRLTIAGGVATVALTLLGGIATWYVGARPAMLPAQAGFGPDAPTVAPVIVASAPAAPAADTPSAAPPAVSAPALTPTEPPRAEVPPLRSAPPSASSARPNLKPRGAPTTPPPARKTEFDPGI